MAILLPLDVCAPSSASLPYAVSLAVALSTSIVVLHVAPGPPPLWMLEVLHRLTAPIKQAGIKHCLRVRQGSPAEIICEEAVRRDCHWIVLGAGAEPLGLLADAVLRKSSAPVVAVGSDRTLHLTTTAAAEKLCRLLSTHGSVLQLANHVVLSAVLHPMDQDG